ncbi:hypothetical protein ACVXG7_09210 [Enterobacter hormaechei]
MAKLEGSNTRIFAMLDTPAVTFRTLRIRIQELIMAINCANYD